MSTKTKNPHAQKLGRLGGKATAASFSHEHFQAIGRKGAEIKKAKRQKDIWHTT